MKLFLVKIDKQCVNLSKQAIAKRMKQSSVCLQLEPISDYKLPRFSKLGQSNYLIKLSPENSYQYKISKRFIQYLDISCVINNACLLKKFLNKQITWCINIDTLFELIYTDKLSQLINLMHFYTKLLQVNEKVYTYSIYDRKNLLEAFVLIYNESKKK